MKELVIPRLPQLDKMTLQQVGQCLDNNIEHELIDCVNWPNEFSYKPITRFVVAASDTRLYLYFSVIAKGLRAIHTNDLSPVAEDSCVEFFMQIPGQDEYWNFEWNCIGTLNGSHRVERPSPTRLTVEQLSSIKRYASCGTEAIEEQDGTFCWDLTVSIPLNLVGLDSENLPNYIMGNFNKCSSKGAHRHYVSWNPINSEKPDFHRPDYFGKLWFNPPVKEPEITTVAEQAQSTWFKRLINKLFSR